MEKKKIVKQVRKLPVLTCAVVFACIGAFVLPEIASVCIFDRGAVLSGSLWRLLTSHWVHFSGLHLLFNLAAFAAGGWVVERQSRCQFMVCYIFMASVIATALLFMHPGMACYGGLSGVAIGFIYYGAFLKVKERKWRGICQCILVFLPIKTILELYSGGSLLLNGGPQTFVVMPVSHVAGIVAAVVLFFVANYVQRYQRFAYMV